MPATSPLSPNGTTAPDFATVFVHLAPHLAALDRFVDGQISSFEPEIRELAAYCLDTTGKRLRPALVFLSGWRGEEVVADDLVRLAAVVEMVHLATLVHDDIMDGADLRRGRATAAKKYGSAAAVLLGDALFAHAVSLATQFPTTEVCRAVAESTRRVCSGEIIQTLRRGDAKLTVSDYRRIVELKTAELFHVSCHLGSRLAGFRREYTEAVSEFGRRLGVAYQIYDDLADFLGSEQRIGKTLGTDFASGKFTLPLLLLLKKLGAAERAELLGDIAAGDARARLSRHVRSMADRGVFEEVARTVREEISEAERALVGFENQPPTALLLRLCELLRVQLGNLSPVPCV